MFPFTQKISSGLPYLWTQIKMCPKLVDCCPNGPKIPTEISQSLPVLLHPQCNERNKSKTMKSFLFVQKKKKKEKKRKQVKGVAFKTSLTNDDNNTIFIQHWLHNYIYTKTNT